MQPAVHDVTDKTAMRSWFNVPLGSTLEGDIYKATNIVRAFSAIGNNPPERSIPSHILRDAAGFAILSTLKVESFLPLGSEVPCTTGEGGIMKSQLLLT